MEKWKECQKNVWHIILISVVSVFAAALLIATLPFLEGRFRESRTFLHQILRYLYQGIYTQVKTF